MRVLDVFIEQKLRQMFVFNLKASVYHMPIGQMCCQRNLNPNMCALNFV